MQTTAETTAQLLQARRSGQPQAAATPADTESAYAVQAAVAQALGWFAASAPQHWKSGGRSREDVTTHAPLPPTGVWASPADAGTWPFHMRGIEAEVALRLGTAVDAQRAAGLDWAQARDMVDAVCVSIEIVDSRWTQGLEAPPLAKLADLQSHGALVLGAWAPFDAAHDWSAQRCAVHIGDHRVHHFQGSHSMGDPVFVLPAWLRHVTRAGAVVPAGTVVTTGTWCGLLHAHGGDRVLVQFDGIGEASVQL